MFLVTALLLPGPKAAMAPNHHAVVGMISDFA